MPTLCRCPGQGEDSINRCPPGGEEGIRKLAALLHVDYLPFAADAPASKPKAMALIDESTCIGCTLCIQACPVDAILGSAKQMHTVLADECTGCELCLALSGGLHQHAPCHAARQTGAGATR
jgi:electron transport complex protein RnfB